MSREKVIKDLRQGILEVERTLEIPPPKWCDEAVCSTGRIMSWLNGTYSELQNREFTATVDDKIR